MFGLTLREAGSGFVPLLDAEGLDDSIFAVPHFQKERLPDTQ